jgi:hypothetical protein
MGHLGSVATPCWVGNPALPPPQQGLQVLGAPLGHAAYIQAKLEATRADHNLLLARLPAVPDLQAAWLLLGLCASPRCNYLLRLLPPSATAAFASQHDEAVRACLARLLDAGELPPGPAASRAHLSLHHGGLGLRSAVRLAPAAYWASWADALPLLHRRLPQAAARLLQQLQAGASSTTECLQQAAASAQALAAAGFEPPPWQELTGSEAAPPATPPATAQTGPEAGKEPQRQALTKQTWQACAATAPQPNKPYSTPKAALGPPAT